MISEGQYLKGVGKITHCQKLEGYGSSNFRVVNEAGEQFLIKVYPAAEADTIREEIRIIHAIGKLHFELPEHVGHMSITLEGIPFFVRISKFMNGAPLTRHTCNHENISLIARSAASMLRVLSKVESPVYQAKVHDWNLRDAYLVFPKANYISDASEAKIVKHFFNEFKARYFDAYLSLRQGLMHGDLNEANLITENGKFKGIIDFGDVSYGPLIGELAILMTYILMMFPEECVEIGKNLVTAFHHVFPLEEREIEILPLLIAVRLSVSVSQSAEKKYFGGDTAYILISEKPAWHLLQKWVSLSPDMLVNEFKKAAGYTATYPDSDLLLRRRLRVAAPSLSLSYDKPIHMTGALFQYMYDAQGHAFLDAYNNIPHIGHCHPAVAEAASAQLSKLNTNTRYLYDLYTDYAELLLSRFPPSLDKLFLVNSGSEASDLAIRIAKTVTQKQGIAIVKWGYHGNTQNGIHISSYKFDRKGGKGPEDHILTLPLPKAFIGAHHDVRDYILEAVTLIEHFEAEKYPLAAFITEPISGCGGQVPLMEGYLQGLATYLRSKGILIIVDEVQTGFGRLGNWFWGFEMHGVEPDFVVLGKPMGNGHPMGGVVTKNEITEAFRNGMEFFSSFGGNPVSCAVGKAVLHTIMHENLQQNALDTGNYWKEQLKKLASAHPKLADIRGEGLFLGIECLDDDLKENTLLAQRIKNELRNHHILASTDGPLDNVLKMKPPLCFQKSNVDHFCSVLSDIMDQL